MDFTLALETTTSTILPALTSLSLSALSGPIEPFLPAFIAVAPHLHHLKLSGPFLTQTLPYLKNCTSLQSLTYTHAPKHLDILLAALPFHLPTLTLHIPFAYETTEMCILM